MRYALTDVISDLLGVPITERGENAMVRCPLHEDRTPSLSVNLDNGLWLCFSCGEKGGIEKLGELMEREVDPVELASRKVQAMSADYISVDLTPIALQAEGSSALLRAYLSQRRLDPQVAESFRLGTRVWPPDEKHNFERTAIAMPYWDDGRVTGIKYRGADGFKWSEKYSKYGIYNVDQVRGAPVVVLCEGESDTHALWGRARRFETPVAVGGISGANHDKAQWELWALDLLWAQRVYIAFDADEAGDKGAAIAMSVLGEKGVRLRPTRGKDMSEHLSAGGTLRESGLDVSDLLALVAA